MPTMRRGRAARLTSRAPIASATRPPICIERIAAAPAQKSMIAIWVASKPSLSRSEGSEPPNPPITTPLTTNINVTAIAASSGRELVDDRCRGGHPQFLYRFSNGGPLYARLPRIAKKMRLGRLRVPSHRMCGPEPCDSRVSANGRSRIDEAPTRSARMSITRHAARRDDAYAWLWPIQGWSGVG